MSTAPFLVNAQLVVVISDRRLGTTYRSLLQKIMTPEAREDGTDRFPKINPLTPNDL
jgi:hypothetical protein